LNNTDLGRVQAYLMRHRIISTHALRRNLSKEEREIATLLRDCDPSMRELLEEIFEGHGFTLESMNDLDANAIPTGATVFLLARLPDFNSPCYGVDRLISKMRQVRGIDSDADAKIWFVQLWFILLDLLYTRRDRHPNSFQDWVETAFRKTVCFDCVKEYINEHVLKIDRTTLKTDQIYAALKGPKEATFTQLCNAFIEAMVNASLLEELESKTTYRQTLLFAYEVKINFDRQLATVMLPAAPFEAATAVLVSESEGN
jgi:hypothetical protein